MTLSWTNLDNDVADSCLVGYSVWIVLTSRTQFFNCPLHVGTATTRDEINIKRLLRYLVGNPACNMIVGCNLDVPGIPGTPQGSVVVMTDADWAGDVKDRRSYSGIAVCVKGSVENTWYPVYASSKKQNMVSLSSGESELMALVGGACEGIATRDQWSKLCKCSCGMIVLCTDSSATLGLVKRKGASRRTRHVDTKVYFMQAWAMEPGQRILKIAPQGGITLTIWTFRSQHHNRPPHGRELHGAATSSSVSCPQVTHSAISPQVQTGPTRTVTSDLVAATLAEAATQLSFAAFLERCISVSASPPLPLPIPTPPLDAAKRTIPHIAVSQDVSTQLSLEEFSLRCV